MTSYVALNDRQIRLLDLAADNGGVIYYSHKGMSPPDRTATDYLTRSGLLTPPGRGWPSENARRITDHGWRAHANLTVARAARIIGPHIAGLRATDRAWGAAEDLRAAGYLTGGDRVGRPDLTEEATYLLCCRHDPATAARIVRELADARLLAGQNLPED